MPDKEKTFPEVIKEGYDSAYNTGIDHAIAICKEYLVTGHLMVITKIILKLEALKEQKP